MIAYKPRKIYLDPAVEHSPITQNILNAFPLTPVEIVSGQPNVIEETKKFADPLLEGKKRLWITRNKGNLIKKCGASTSSSAQNSVCCNYFILEKNWGPLTEGPAFS